MAATNTAPVGGISVLVGLCTPAAALIPPTSGGSGGIPILQRRRNYPTPSYQLGTVFVFCVSRFCGNFLLQQWCCVLTCLFVFSVFLSVIGLRLNFCPDRPHLERTMSRGSQEESDGDYPRSPSMVGEGSMMEMFRLLMDGQRQAEEARERKREEKEREAAREQHERLLALQAGERESEKLKLERQMAYEARQLEQQLAILKAQVDLGEKANKTHREGQDQDRKRNRVLTSIAEWKEGEDLEEFFLMAERRMKSVEIREEEWIGIIDLKLKGKMSIAWQDASALAGDYAEAKGKVLKMCGYTPKLAAEGFYSFRTEQCKGLTADQLFHKGLQMLRRMLAPVKIAEEAEFALMRGWVCHVIPKRARGVLDTRPLGSSTELVSALQDYLSMEGDSREGQAATFKGEHVSQGERPKERFGSLVCFKCGKNGHKAADCWQGMGSGQQKAPTGESSGYKVICFTCGVEGHKSPQCPKNARGEKQGGKEGKEAKPKPVMRIGNGRVGGPQLEGSVSGVDTLILLDSGADITLVPEALVDPSQLTGGTVAVKAFGARHPLLLPTADVPFRIGDAEWIERVGVAPRQEGVAEEVIYSLNLRSQRGVALVQLMNKESPKEVKRVTDRAVAKKEKQEAEEELAELIVCSPEVKPLPGGRDVSDVPGVEVELDEVELVEEEVEVEDVEEHSPEVKPLPGGRDVSDVPGVEVELDEVELVEEEAEVEDVEEQEMESSDLVEVVLNPVSGEADVEEQEMEASELVEVVLDPASGEASKEPELDIPIVKKGSGDRDALVAETRSDPSLDQWRRLADRGEEGFVWEKGLLHQEVMTQVLEKGLVLVLPKSFREGVLVVAHDKMQHMGAGRVTRLIQQWFTWPGVGQDIAKFCRACPTCQKYSKRKSRKTWMIERPVMSEPLEDLDCGEWADWLQARTQDFEKGGSEYRMAIRPRRRGGCGICVKILHYE